MSSDDSDDKKGKKSAEDKELEKEARHRQIVPVATGEVSKILAWLEGLFILSPNDAAPGKVKSEPDSMPERIVMCPVYGFGGRERGPEINPRTFKPLTQRPPGREALVELANEYYRKARQHATAMRTRQRYCLFAYNNVKGADAYDHHPFVVVPGPKDAEATREFGTSAYSAPAADDEDTHRDREIESLRADRRWMFEQMTEYTSGVMRLQQEVIQDLREENRQLLSDRRADRIAAEEALSKAAERRAQEKWAETRNMVINDMWGYAKAQVLPAVTAYLSKGRVGIAQMMGAFFQSLDDKQRETIFGEWQKQGDRDVRTRPGILDEDQVHIFINVLEGNMPPARVTDFMTSLRPEQYAAAQGILRQEQVQQLMTLAKVAGELSN